MCSIKFDSEFHRRRACRAAQGHHESGGEPGAAFFGLLFLAAQEKWPAAGLPPV